VTHVCGDWLSGMAGVVSVSLSTFALGSVRSFVVVLEPRIVLDSFFLPTTLEAL